MMPPSKQKGKTRAKRAPAADVVSDAETPEAVPTPSKPSRKRARQSEAAASVVPLRSTRRKVKDTRALDREDTEGTEAQEQSDAETEPGLPTEQEIIQHLKIAQRQVHATEDFANDLLEGQEHVPGYGKIAGRGWAFIIRKIEVNIGRPEANERLNTDKQGGEEAPSAKTVIDIDLGPDRQVSRQHATIAYESERMEWYIVVGGRNGLRVDTVLYKRGQRTYLRNGSVIDVAGTQMAFVTTPNEDSEGPTFDAAIIRQAQKSSEEDDDGDDNMRPHPHAHPSARGGRQQLPQDPNIAFPSDFAYSGQQQHRTHPHSLAHHPGTPSRTTQMAFPQKSSPMAGYARGVMMESTETIDYSQDGAKDLKPPHSYAQLIGMAILSTPDQQMTLSNIYKWIAANYAFYRFNNGGWQNSIRHNLSLNKAFTKIARRTDEPGKGMKWIIAPEEFESFVSQGMKGCRRPVHPVNPMNGTQSVNCSPSSPATNMRQKLDDDFTPPLLSYHPAYPSALEAYTPDRGPRRQLQHGLGLGINGDAPELDFLTRSTPRSNGLTAAANAAGSPPALYINDEGRMGPLDTPFPMRPSQKFAPPMSTLKRPSDYIQFSSPAPFWKMEGLTGSTPMKPFDMSPIKSLSSAMKPASTGGLKMDGDLDSGTKHEEIKEGEQKEPTSPTIESSSPPRPQSSGYVLDSPTASRPATAAGKILSQMSRASQSPVGVQSEQAPSPSMSNAGSSLPPAQQQPTPTPTQPPVLQAPVNHAPASMTNGNAPPNGVGHGHARLMNPYTEPDEEEGIDLVKGFQPIGYFHQRQHQNLSLGAYGR